MRIRSVLGILCLSVTFLSSAQLDGNTTPTYHELIEMYQKLATENAEIELYAMGESDYGLPIYVCLLNGAQDSLRTFEKARKSTTLLINNGIHPGEPDGINACLLWIEEWIKNGKKTKNMPVIGIIPAYNVGGMMNRSASSRANQEGPDEYGFRGNAQNLDLNRDFIKMDSKNMFTFATIFHALDPDVFIDTHVSNGADYQYTLTYISSMKERLSPSIAGIVYDQFLPFLTKDLGKKKTDLIGYVNLEGDVPEEGMSAFNDLPRYSMGYASLFNCMSFTIETHMLKPFKERAEATLLFLKSTVDWMSDNATSIERARAEAFRYDRESFVFPFNYELTAQKDSIQFKGYEHSYPLSEVTGLPRLKYHRDRPFTKYIPYFKTYAPTDSVDIPDYYVVGGQCTEIIARLKANGIEMEPFVPKPYTSFEQYKMKGFKSNDRPYEGHFIHYEISTELVKPLEVMLKEGDVLIPTNQRNRRFVISVLEPEMPDSYFAWNYLDSYVQQKEYFSSYVFEDKAAEILKGDTELKRLFEAKKSTDQEFAKNANQQLYFIYQHSEYYEPTHNLLPIFRLVR